MDLGCQSWTWWYNPELSSWEILTEAWLSWVLLYSYELDEEVSLSF
jgi:hypothetical protein